MKISLGVIEVSDEARRAFAARSGKRGLATREEIRAFIRSEGGAGFDAACVEGRERLRGYDPDEADADHDGETEAG